MGSADDRRAGGPAVTARLRLELLRAVNPHAVTLAAACALSARVEPTLLRRLRLLIPGADASAESDLWFSDLFSARDAAAVALDPLVAELLREGLRRPSATAFLRDAVEEIAAAHATAHWSVRLEERIHHLDVTRPPGADDDIDDLVLAALDQLRQEPDPRGIARWLLGAVGRFPRRVVARTASRAARAAAMLHLDRQAPPGDLSAGETQTWLPWLATTLPRISVPVQLLDGAVVLGAEGPGSVELPEVPDTDPLVVEVRWTDGVCAHSRCVRFRTGEPVQVETGSQTASLVTLLGASYEVAVDEQESAGLRFDRVKVGLRPCLGRSQEIADLLRDVLDPSSSWVGIRGGPGSGTSTVLVAVTDALRRDGVAVVEHFYSATTDPVVIEESCLAQLRVLYSEYTHINGRSFTGLLDDLARQGAFRRPLVIALDEFPVNGDRLFLADVPAGVHHLVTTTRWLDLRDRLATQSLRVKHFTADATREVGRALVRRHLAEVEHAFVGPVDVEALVDLAGNSPRAVVRILRWIARQPTNSVTADNVPPLLTAGWTDVRAALGRRFGRQLTHLLYMLYLAQHRHPWFDCAVVEPSWRVFWSACLDNGLVEDTGEGSVVELAAPEAADVLRAPADSRDETVRRFVFGKSRILDFVANASLTRLANAVTHLLAVGDTEVPEHLCRQLTFLVRRYAEDRAGLLADLAALPGDPGMRTLWTVISQIADLGVPPAGFAPALRDWLTVRAEPRLVSGFGLRPPLRVRRAITESELRPAGIGEDRLHPGPALAIAVIGGRPVVVTRFGVHAMDGSLIGASAEIDGANGGAWGYVAWHGRTIWTDVHPRQPVDLPIDRAQRHGEALTVAGTDGSVTRPSVSDRGRRILEIPGRGARVTAMGALDTTPARWIVGYADGTIHDQGSSRERIEHRGAVRAVVCTSEDSFVSGGDDGSLVFWAPGLEVIRRRHVEPPVTCLARMPDDAVLVGSANGEVTRWDPVSDELVVLGRHIHPVRGVAHVASSFVLSWADSIRYWNAAGSGGLLAQEVGFPGGIVDVLVHEGTYVAMRGDGSVRQRILPDLREERHAFERLVVRERQAYLWLAGTTLSVDAVKGPRLTAGVRPDVAGTAADLGYWRVTAGADGVVRLSVAESGTQVHEIRLGLPVVALAGEPGFVAARDATGQLWMFDLDEPTGVSLVEVVRASVGRAELRIDGDECVIAAVRLTVDGSPVPLRIDGHWPRVRADGSLLCPEAPPLTFRIPPVGRQWGIEVDVVSPLLRGYRTTIVQRGRVDL
ncbi:WD40 repeat domain-containing protein [Amycolatopsis sp. cmx-8-4]|uniref:WD40 repeat domain-containing protein n=1 Tax=Amycolatopsis sp. cmx-8-4 TaxID=2790947 RepID=UPI00397975D2